MRQYLFLSAQLGPSKSARLPANRRALSDIRCFNCSWPNSSRLALKATILMICLMRAVSMLLTLLCSQCLEVLARLSTSPSLFSVRETFRLVELVLLSSPLRLSVLELFLFPQPSNFLMVYWVISSPSLSIRLMLYICSSTKLKVTPTIVLVESLISRTDPYQSSGMLTFRASFLSR